MCKIIIFFFFPKRTHIKMGNSKSKEKDVVITHTSTTVTRERGGKSTPESFSRQLTFSSRDFSSIENAVKNLPKKN